MGRKIVRGCEPYLQRNTLYIYIYNLIRYKNCHNCSVTPAAKINNYQENKNRYLQPPLAALVTFVTLQTRCAPYPLDSIVQRGQTPPDGNLPGSGPRRNPGRVKPSQLVELVKGRPLDLKWNVLVLVWGQGGNILWNEAWDLESFKLWLSGVIVANINVPMHSKVNLLYSLLGIPSKI